MIYIPRDCHTHYSQPVFCYKNKIVLLFVKNDKFKLNCTEIQIHMCSIISKSTVPLKKHPLSFAEFLFAALALKPSLVFLWLLYTIAHCIGTSCVGYSDVRYLSGPAIRSVSVFVCTSKDIEGRKGVSTSRPPSQPYLVFLLME